MTCSQNLMFAPALTINLTGNIFFQTPFGSCENFLPYKKEEKNPAIHTDFSITARIVAFFAKRALFVAPARGHKWSVIAPPGKGRLCLTSCKNRETGTS